MNENGNQHWTLHRNIVDAVSASTFGCRESDRKWWVKWSLVSEWAHNEIKSSRAIRGKETKSHTAPNANISKFDNTKPLRLHIFAYVWSIFIYIYKNYFGLVHNELNINCKQSMCLLRVVLFTLDIQFEQGK